MLPSIHLFLANPENERTVHLQGANRGPPGCGQPEQFNSDPAEVIMPAVTTRVEQRHLLAGRGVGASPAASLRSEQDTHAKARFASVVGPPS